MDADLPRSPKVHETIGFEFEAYDGGLNPFRYWHQVPAPGVHCPRCYSPLDQEALSQNVSIRGKADVYWASGHLIVSDAFRSFCLASGYDDVEFPRVRTGRQILFELRPTRVLDVDFERSEPLLREFCLRCGNFACYLTGRGLYFHDVAEPLEDGFYRTNLIFGCASAKYPIVVVGHDTMRRIAGAKFKGVAFTPVPNVDPSFEHRKKGSVDSDIRHRRRLSGGRPWRPKGTAIDWT
jgi:hypothetical protein